jgi:hypothetical protein
MIVSGLRKSALEEGENRETRPPIEDVRALPLKVRQD